jgi:hypothetical protein
VGPAVTAGLPAVRASRCFSLSWGPVRSNAPGAAVNERRSQRRSPSRMVQLALPGVLPRTLNLEPLLRPAALAALAAVLMKCTAGADAPALETVRPLVQWGWG